MYTLMFGRRWNQRGSEWQDEFSYLSESPSFFVGRVVSCCNNNVFFGQFCCCHGRKGGVFLIVDSIVPLVPKLPARVVDDEQPCRFQRCLSKTPVDDVNYGVGCH